MSGAWPGGQGVNDVCARNECSTTRRARWRAAVRFLLLALPVILAQALPRTAASQPVKGELSVAVENGYARFVFHLEEEVESRVRLANNILTIAFERPVDIAVDRISANSAGYVGAARRDPDGRAIRLALARKVTMNSMSAGDRLFVDLLPDTWTGLPPGLPRDVIEELARRAREAERRVRQQRTLARQRQMAPIPVRVVTQPTFTRYIFDLPELIGVSADNTRDKLTLTFDSVLRFDLADAKATLPKAIESIDSELDHDSVLVKFAFSAKVDVRTFREDNNYVVDVGLAGANGTRQEGAVRSDELTELAMELAARQAAPPGGVQPPQTVPARGAAPGAAPVSPPAAKQAPPLSKQPSSVPSQQAAAPFPPPDRAIPAVPAQQRAAATPRVAPPRHGAAPSPPMQPATPAKAAPPASAPKAAAPAARTPGDDDRPVETPRAPGTAVKVALRRHESKVDLVFPFRSQTAAAVFRRADTVWLVFDTAEQIAVGDLNAVQGTNIRSATVARERDVAVVRVHLDRPQLISVAAEGPVWTITIGSEVVAPTRPLGISRNIVAAARSSAVISIDGAQKLHRIDDPEAGDTLYVVTAPAPARGLVKSQDFVEFRALASSHGIALQPIADDLNVEMSVDKIVITRPTGLTLSAAMKRGEQTVLHRHVLDAQSWGFDRQADFRTRRSQLLMAAADAPESRRLPARCDLARFYLARDMYAEAKAVLDVAIADNPPTAEDSSPAVLHAIANVMLGRPDAALKDLANPVVGDQHDAPLWRAFANARLGKWAEARETFRNVEAAMGTLPLELQRAIMKEMIRAFIEVGDVTGAARQMNDFELVGVPREYEPALAVLSGRLAEKLGRVQDALRAYRAATDSWDRPAAAQGRLREILLQHAQGTIKLADAVAELETLTTAWRGDETEVEALQLLARLYTEDSRYRDAFQVMRTTLKAHPNSDLTRRIQEEAAMTFDSLFLAGKGDSLPAIDALALFYDFRELTPIGRRGDEMIRRLADRLVSVDLLYQASELLQHQIDHRLQGAARAHVATRLAVIYLMDRKPDRALAALHSTRISQLNNDLRNQRLLLEARALSDLGRHEVAIEVIANIEGREAVRLRADIFWKAREWVRAAEQIELLLGTRWQDFAPLTDTERIDVLRAAIGYVLGEDSLGLIRFREKFASKMGDGPARRAFEVVTAPVAADGAEFREIAHSIAAIDTLEAFLRDLRARYPDTGVMPAQAAPAPAVRPAPAANEPPPAAAG
jgi:tetratricopeptide (TPR) repeat protein